jgi:hypothetical protein
MKKSISKGKHKPPFRPEELLSAGSFISYCRDNGINISKEELELFHKEGLFFPAVKVYRGVCEFKKIYAKFEKSEEWRYIYLKDVKKFMPKKIDPKKYYSSGSFHMGNANWLNYYEKNKMVEYPAMEKFKVWNIKSHLDFITNRKLIEKEYELFYDKIQLISLKSILREKMFWTNFKGLEKIELIKYFKKSLVKMNHFFEIYIVIEDFINRVYQIRQEKISAYKKSGMNAKQIKIEWQEELDFTLMGSAKQTAQGILKQYSFSSKEIADWTRFLAWQNIFSESHRSSRCIGTYLKSISERDFIVAEDVNFMIHIFNSFVFFLTGEQKTVKQIISNSQYPVCPVCGSSFLPSRITQKTCGSAECIRENKNQSKRKRK